MTLNITVATDRCIYQCADFRVTDTKTGKWIDFDTQKIALVNAYRWSATVCFAGVGRTDQLNVGYWLAERIAAIHPAGAFETLLDELLKADNWLASVPSPHNRHSFSIGAFVGARPVFALISNFEDPYGTIASLASKSLSHFVVPVTTPKVFVSGQTHEVSRPQRKWLIRYAKKDLKPEVMYSALVAVNQDVAMHNDKVSHACFTTHLRLTGDGGSQGHDLVDRSYFPNFAFPAGTRESIKQLLDKQFGPGRYRVAATSFARSDASDEYHKVQLREKPDDPNVHSNYGAFLKEKKGDVVGAEREYRLAIELNPKHVNALGNLANLAWEKGDKEQADRLYREALEVGAGAGTENVTWNYARFLLKERNDNNAACDILDRGIANNPQSGRLLVLRGEASLLNGNASEALDFFRRAREKGADQVAVESGYAIALHMSGAPVGESIAAYRVAISLRPKDGPLRLNLAQLLFISGDEAEAASQLRDAMALGLDEAAQLEAQFYLLAHRSWESVAVIETMKFLLTKGARLRWDVCANIEAVARTCPNKAVILETVSKVLMGKLHRDLLDHIASSWPPVDQH